MASIQIIFLITQASMQRKKILYKNITDLYVEKILQTFNIVY